MRKIVAISGAAGGLGPTVTRAFFEAGASVAVAGRSEGKLVDLLDSIGVPVEKRLITGVDLGDAGAAGAWAEAVRKKFGRVDVVLHLVGGYKGGNSITQISSSDWKELEGMLVGTTINVVRAFAVYLKEGKGRFIGVSSPKAQAPTARSALYSMAKAASDALVMALADELRGTGSTANLIVVNSIGNEVIKQQIAAAMLFLCSDVAESINGVRLPL